MINRRNIKLVDKIKKSGVAPKGTSMGKSEGIIDRMLAGRTKTGAKHWVTKKPKPKRANEDSEYDNEGGMAKGQLQTIADAALELHDMLKDDTNMPEWVQSKITKAADYIDTARDYMKNELPMESVKEDAPSMSMGGGHIASHDAFPLGHPDMKRKKEIDVVDKRYKKKQRQGETVLLKRFKGHMRDLDKG